MEMRLENVPLLIGFGTALREKRRAWGLSQRKLADMAGTTQTAVARIEAGVGNPTINSLEALTNALGADLQIKLLHHTGRRLP